jgi:transcriptional regulator with XRE-family HTH domain
MTAAKRQAPLSFSKATIVFLGDREQTKRFLVDCRRVAGMSQEQLATALHTHQSKVSRMEAGVRSGIDAYTRWAGAFGFKALIAIVPRGDEEETDG